MPNPDFIPLDIPEKSNPDFISLEPTGNEKALENRPDDSTVTGTLKNLGTAAIKGVSHIPGMLGDARDFAKYLTARGTAFATGRPVDDVQRDMEAETERRRNSGVLGRILDAPNYLPSGGSIAAPVLEKTGEYQPTTPMGRLGAAGVEGGLAMVGPGGISGGMKAAETGASALRIAKDVLKGGAKAVPGGAAAGVVGDEATQITGDPLVGMIASSAVPFASSAVKHAGKEAAAPFVPSMRQGAADKRLTKSATNPKEAIEATQARPPKEGETLGEATLDPGILHTEKAAANLPGSFQEGQPARLTARNEGRVGTIDALAPAADTLAPSKLFRQRLADIEAVTQEAVERATEQAKAAEAHHAGVRDTTVPAADPMAVVRGATERVQGAERTAQESIEAATKAKDTAHGDLPPGTPVDATGEALRNIVADADKAKGAMVRKLYEAVDPDGELRVVTSGPAEAAQALRKSINPEVEVPSPIAAPIIDMVAHLKPVTSFADLMKLDRTITAKMSEAARTGDRTGHGQLVQLKGHIMGAVDNAVENNVKWQQAAKARGELEPSTDILDNLRGLALDHEQQVLQRQQSQSRKAVGESSAGDASSGPAAVHSVVGGESASGKGRTVSAGDPGVPGDQPRFDEGAIERLGAAKEAHKERATTFREGPVGQSLKTNGFAGQYTQPAAKVPASAFPKGDLGHNNVGAWLKAAGDDPAAIPTLREVAVSRLRDAMKGGDLTPKVLDAWKREYGPALRALDEAQPGSGFLSKFETAAKATDALETQAVIAKETVRAAQESAAAKFMDLTRPEEVGSTLMGMVKGKTGPTQVAEAVSQMDAAAKAGAQDALFKTLIRDHTNADGVLAADRYRKFVADNRPALLEVYGPAGVNRLFGVAHTALAARAAVEGVERAVAGQKLALKEAQQGAAAKFLNLTNPAEVGDTLIGMVKSKTGPTQLADLWGTMDDSGKAGAKRALTDTILRDHQNADRSLSGAKLKNFIDDNAAALEQVYGKDGMGVLTGLADDAARYQKAAGIQRNPFGADSFANFMRWAREKAGPAANASLGGALLLSGVDAAAHFNIMHVATVMGMAGVRHLLSTMRANGLRKINDLVELGLTNPEVGAAMMQRALDNKGTFKADSLANLNKAILRATADRETLEEHSRIGRASGGSVKIDHAEHAARLVRLVDQARKETTQDTKPLLRLPDSAVSHALAIANERLA